MNVQPIRPQHLISRLLSPKVFIGLVALLVFFFTFCVFTVDQTQTAIRFRLGKIIQADYASGLHFMVPFIDNVRKFDARIQTLDTRAERLERFLTAEKKNVIVDSFVKWRIDKGVDEKGVSKVALFYTAVAGDPAKANQRLEQIVTNNLRSEFGKRTLQEVVSGDRQQIMDILTKIARDEARQIGIEVVDVRIKRIDLPPEVSTSVFRRMRAERERVAMDFRSRGAEAAERIRADADRQRTVTLAEAYRDAERTRGEGDAKAAAIYAAAYSQDPDFYRFYRSLSAYRNSFTGKDDILVLQPDSQFFKYFKNIQ